MTTKHPLFLLVVVTAMQGSAAVSAGNDQPSYYDEDRGTVVFNFAGHPVAPEVPKTPHQAVEKIPPYYDEERDTVVYNLVEQPVEQATAMAGRPE